MEHRIEAKELFKVVGLSVNTTVQNAQKDIRPVWEEFVKRNNEVQKAVGGMKNYGVCFEKSVENCDFKYIACCEVSEFENIPENMVMAEISPSNYAIFVHKGKLDGLGKTYEDIMEYMKKENMKKKDFWFEFYDQRWKGDKPESEFEIWVAIE